MDKKKILLSILGEKKYLFVVANAFQQLSRIGGLGREYQDIYFLKKFIRKGDWCIDIGAHLGYFSLELGRLVRPDGKVFAVEPISKFNKVLRRLLSIYKVRNVTVNPVALGGKGDFVEMGIPEVDHSKRFAYARVMESSPGLHYIESEKVANKAGDELFRDLERLDFVKCDVEGLEYPVFLSMMQTIKKHSPIILCEFFDRNERLKLYELLAPLGYRLFKLEKNKWHALDAYAEGAIVSQNNYLIPAGPRQRLRHLFEQVV